METQGLKIRSKMSFGHRNIPECPVCHATEGYWSNVHGCCDKCASKINQRNQRIKRKLLNESSRYGFSSGVVSRLCMDAVYYDLLKKGYEVFESREATHPFQFIAIKDDKVCRMKVTSAIILPSGRISVKKEAIQGLDKQLYDKLAIVQNFNLVTYLSESVKSPAVELKDKPGLDLPLD